MNTHKAVAVEAIAQRIHFIRGCKVMLDIDLAELYGITTKALNQAVKRNIQRFPDDFMFRLKVAEVANLNRSQTVTGSQRHRDPRFPPFAFTEHGALMLGNVLRSHQAVEVSLLVVRAFVQLREMLSTHKELAAKLEALEMKVGNHDQAIAELVHAIRQLMTPPATKQRPIGFVVSESKNTKSGSRHRSG
jgi:phage regulator Rha-like protein